MAQDTLVSEEIEDGKCLLEWFAQEGIPVSAAFWLKESDSGWWYLYLVTPLVTADGRTLAAYRRVGEVLRRRQQPTWVSGMEIKVVGEQEPLALDALALLRQAEARPVRWNGGVLGQRRFDGAYFYPVHQPSP
jgi:hypothetical protein